MNFNSGIILTKKFKIMRYLKITLMCFCCFLCVETQAQDENNPWLLTVGINSVDNRIPTNIRGLLEDYFGVGGDQNVLFSVSTFSARRYLKNGFSLGINTSINDIDKGFGKEAGNSGNSFFAIGTNVRYDVNKLVGETGWFDPFVSLGVNYTRIGKDNDYPIELGYGFHTWFNENLGLTFASSYNHGFEHTGNDYFQHSLGVSFRFGRNDADGDGVSDAKDLCPNEVGLPALNGCPDDDGDGIVNRDDACPNAVGSIDLQGCPDSDGDGIANSEDACPEAAGSSVSNGCPDSDEDGVLDKYDSCIRQAGPASNNGCPWPDTDGDGILDKNDKCFDKVGPVSNQGCPELTAEEPKKVVDLKKSFTFYFGGNTFKPGVLKELDGLVKIMKTLPDVNFSIEGHADSIGSEDVNLNLSKTRANAVREYLISKGIHAHRMRVIGFGEKKPVASNKTTKGRSLNRRVEVIAIK